MRAVVWTELLQAAVYILGGICRADRVSGRLGDGRLGDDLVERRAPRASCSVLDFSFTAVDRRTPIWAGLIGGAFLAMASHGADQLIVQRLLSSRTLQGRAAARSSAAAFVVFAQFTLFLCIGLGLWAFYQGRAFPATGSDLPDVHRRADAARARRADPRRHRRRDDEHALGRDQLARRRRRRTTSICR